MMTGVCAYCGEEFLKKYSGQRFCFAKCANNSRRKKPTLANCERCGKEFAKKESIQRFCCKECGNNGRRKKPAEVRFWSHVDKNGPIPEHCPEIGNCWIWTKSIGNHGYGMFCPVRTNAICTHRYSYILTFGEIPKNACVLHHCDNRACVRPDHLFLGDKKDNVHDCMKKGRFAIGERSGMAKLTSTDVLDMRRMRFQEGTYYYVIADYFGVDYRTAYNAINGINWKHLVS